MSNNTHGQDGTEDESDEGEERSRPDEGVADSEGSGSVEGAIDWDEATESGALSDRLGERGGPAERASEGPPTDRLFQLLASPGNRFVLTFLLKVDGPAEYADLVEYVVARAEPPEEMTEAKFRGRVAATLINERLPELADAGLVEVDSARQLVSPTSTTAVAAPHLALALSDIVAPTHRE